MNIRLSLVFTLMVGFAGGASANSFSQPTGVQPADFEIDRGDEVIVAQEKSAPVSTQCRRPRNRFLFNVDQQDIRSLLKKIARITCKNFIVSEGVKGKNDITIISHKKVNVDQAYAAFLAALEANNMALVRAGRFYKVVERKDAKKQPLPMYENGKDLPWTDAQVTLLHQLSFAGVDQVQPLVKNLMTKAGAVDEIGGNMLLITDSASNIRRIMKILDKVDVAGSSSRMHIVDINWAEAGQISQKLTEIFQDTTTKGGKGGTREDVSIDKMIADERTNKLIIICSDSAFESVKEVIDILDTQDGAGASGAQVFVHPLNNADATKLASTLTSLTSGAKSSTARGGKGKAAAKAAAAAELFEGDVKITADEATNGLVIVSSARDYRSLKDVINSLDAKRPQVYVEAAIMEVAVNENRRVSLDAYAGLPADVPGFSDPGLGIVANEGGKNLVTSSAQALAARSLFDRLNTNTLDASQLGAAVDASTALESLLGVLAFQGPQVPGSEQLFGFPVPSFGVVLNALQSNANVNVLSTPHIMTTDNEKAEISVGERIPVVRGIAPVGGGGLGIGGLQQVAYEDVKLRFVVTPHVNDSGEIRMEIEQEVSDIGGNIPVGNGLEQPIITNRSANTTVVVRDQQSVVLGGLISDRNTDSESKIPFLGDIPIVGWLFKNWSDSTSRTNLILVLTPYIVRSEEDLQRIYARKMLERQQFVEAFYGVAADYNPYVDYAKKTGPLGRLITTIDIEAQKLENGGPGAPGEESFTPDLEMQPFTEEGSDAEAAQ